MKKKKQPQIPPHIWKQMSDEEKWELMYRNFSGTMMNTSDGEMVIMMGKKSFDKIKEYENFLINKYS